MATRTSSKATIEHPFAKKEPKPTRARLVGLLDPLGRRRYAEVERFLAKISGATSGLCYYGKQNGEAWGWAVRYMLDAKTPLCTLHLLPESFEVTIIVPKEMQDAIKTSTLSTDVRRKIGRGRAGTGGKWVRLPLRNDTEFAVFQQLIDLKVETHKAPKKTAKAKKKTA